jgi:hypothetical protein
MIARDSDKKGTQRDDPVNTRRHWSNISCIPLSTCTLRTNKHLTERFPCLRLKGDGFQDMFCRGCFCKRTKRTAPRSVIYELVDEKGLIAGACCCMATVSARPMIMSSTPLKSLYEHKPLVSALASPKRLRGNKHEPVEGS